MEPAAAAERVIAIDALRGLALLGVLIINLLTGFRIPLSGHILGIDEPLGPGGALLLSGVAALIEFKAFTLFSFLFGVGVAIQSERAAGVQFLLRRFGALMAFGLIHLLLVWNGDILTLYAVCGLLLIPLLRVSPFALAGLGAFLIASSYLISLPVHLPDSATLRELTTRASHVYGTAGWHDIVAFRWEETET